MTSVLVSIVTYQSAATIAACLRSLSEQTFTDYRIVVVDNSSSDDSLRQIRQCGIEPISNPVNRGFCAAHNQVIAGSTSEHVLVLNPDVELAPTFLQELVGASARQPRVGAACGKLLRLERGARSNTIDSAGMILRRNQRHLDRGAEENDTGQYDTPGFVFGASGAAAFYRREFIEDVSQGKGLFDEDFFAYREDADLSWRGQWLGWRCLYWPQAVAWHARRVTPERRGLLPAAINYHSVKNRFLMRIKNLDGANYLRNFLPITLRDLGILAYVVLREQTSLPAFSYVWRHFPQSLALRRDLMKKRRATSSEVGAWFTQEIQPLD